MGMYRRSYWHSRLFCLMPGWHIRHPSVFPKPTSNRHAKPFKSINPPLEDTFIVADISVGRRIRFTNSKGAEQGKQMVVAECGVHVAAETFPDVGQRREGPLKGTRFENSPR